MPSTATPVPLVLTIDRKEEEVRFSSSASAPPSYTRRSASEQRKSRLFARLNSGMLWNAIYRNKFLTLTSSPESPPSIWYSWKQLVERIREITPSKLVKHGFIPKNRLSFYYPDKDPDTPLRFEFCAVETAENKPYLENGAGVLHVVCAGDYIPQKFLAVGWYAIHKAYHVNIKEIKSRSGMARYLLNQYILNQNTGNGDCAILRCSTSRDWIYPGWYSDLKEVIAYEMAADPEHGYRDAIARWGALMLRREKLHPERDAKNATLTQFGASTYARSPIKAAVAFNRAWRASIGKSETDPSSGKHSSLKKYRATDDLD